MSFEQYDIFFSGQLIDGSDETVARSKLAALFKLPRERVEHLFSGKPVAVKRGVNMDTAIKYRTAFRDAGALIEIKPITNAAAVGTAASIPAVAPSPTPTAAPPEASKQDQPASSSDLSLSPANTGTLEGFAPEVVPVEIGDISQISMAAVGSTIDEREPPPPLEIDTSALSIEPVEKPLGKP